LEAYKQRELAQLVSYVPQTDGRPFPFTVKEFVTMGRYPYLSPFSALSKKDRAAVNQVLALTGIERFSERHLDTLSGGERQKVFIAGALAQGAGLLLLDEPATFLDYRHQVEVHDILHQVNREKGVTVVMVTHDINSALRHSESVMALKEGSVAYDGPTKGIAENGVLEDLYDTAFFVTRHPAMDSPIILPKATK
jgi:iron complex transport system ATP-binding protein